MDRAEYGDFYAEAQCAEEVRATTRDPPRDTQCFPFLSRLVRGCGVLCPSDFIALLRVRRA